MRLSNIIVIILCILLLYYLFPILNIDGTSMYPTYKDNEKVLARRLLNKRKLVEGEVYVYRRYNDIIGEYIYVIKRLDRIAYDVDCRNQPVPLCYFLGDNPNASIDSRHYGFINGEEVVAKVVKPRALKQK